MFAVLGVWSIMLAAATGPAFQVALGFGLSIYFLTLKRGGKKAIMGEKGRRGAETVPLLTGGPSATPA